MKFQGLRLRDGTLRQVQGGLVDASIIEPPSSTKKQAGANDPEIHQIKKGN
jgi:hypothetical protein